VPGVNVAGVCASAGAARRSVDKRVGNFMVGAVGGDGLSWGVVVGM
jgi:hypothetical protein